MADDKPVAGRPSLCTPEIVDTILTRIAAGESLRSICSAAELPDERTVRYWVVEDRKVVGEEDAEGFAARYFRARDIGLDCRADRIIEEARAATDATKGRLVFDADRWYLSKLAPKRYGDKVALTGGGEGDAPIKQQIEAVVRFVKPGDPPE